MKILGHHDRVAVKAVDALLVLGARHGLLRQPLKHEVGGEEGHVVGRLEGLHRVGEGDGEGAAVGVIQLLLLILDPVCLEVTHLHVPFDQVVQVVVIIVLSKRVEQGFSNVQPAHINDELEDGKEGHDHVGDGVIVVDQVDGAGGEAGHLGEQAILPLEVVGGLEVLGGW